MVRDDQLLLWGRVALLAGLVNKLSQAVVVRILAQLFALLMLLLLMMRLLVVKGVVGGSLPKVVGDGVHFKGSSRLVLIVRLG